MRPRTAAWIVAASAAWAAHAADIYVWTDDSGKTHIADSVPEKYRKSATRIDSSQFEPTPEQQREAAAARAALAQKASAVSAPAAGATRTPPQRAAATVSRPSASRT